MLLIGLFRFLELSFERKVGMKVVFGRVLGIFRGLYRMAVGMMVDLFPLYLIFYRLRGSCLSI